jgi:hypothetical protein
MYGKPGSLHLFAIGFFIFCFIGKLWSARVNIFIAGLLVSYSIKHLCYSLPVIILTALNVNPDLPGAYQ